MEWLAGRQQAANPVRPSTWLAPPLVKFVQRLRVVRLRVRCCLSACLPAVRLRSLLALFLVPVPLQRHSLSLFLSCSPPLVWFFNLRPVQFALFVLSQAHNLLFFPSSVFVGIWKLKKGRESTKRNTRGTCRYAFPSCCCCCCCCSCGHDWSYKVHAAIARHLASD